MELIQIPDANDFSEPDADTYCLGYETGAELQLASCEKQVEAGYISKEELLPQLIDVRRGLQSSLEAQLAKKSNTVIPLRAKLNGVQIAISLISKGVSKDGLVCPRCGEIFHDEDIKNNPAEYYTCPDCGTTEHIKCRGEIVANSIPKDRVIALLSPSENELGYLEISNHIPYSRWLELLGES